MDVHVISCKKNMDLTDLEVRVLVLGGEATNREERFAQVDSIDYRKPQTRVLVMVRRSHA